MLTPSLPRARLVVWALLIPLTYAPLYLTGARPAPSAWLLWAASMALAALAILLVSRSLILDRIASGLASHAGKVLAIAIAAFVVVSAGLVRARLLGFGNFDQGALFGQSFWTLLQGHPFSNTHETVYGTLGSHFGVHFSPTLLLLAPFYALFPTPRTLLAVQALAVGLATVPAYHLLKRDAGRAGALVLALALLAVPNFFGRGVRDFHDAAFLPVLLLTAVWALENRRTRILVLASLGALGLRAEMGLTLALLGLYALLRGHGVRVFAGLAVLGVTWMVVVRTWVTPLFWSPGLWMDPERFFTHVLGHWGSSPLEAARAMLTNPAALVRELVTGENVRYLFNLLSPLLLVPPILDFVWLVAIPTLGVNMLSRLPWMHNAGAYYSLVPLTFFALAAMQVAARVCWQAPLARRPAFGLALGLVVFAGALPSLPLATREFDMPVPPAGPARAVLGVIPPRAAVYGPISLYPWLCNRESFGCWQSLKERGRDRSIRGRYEYVVLWPGSDPPEEPRDRPLADSLAADERFLPIPGYEPFLVFARR